MPVQLPSLAEFKDEAKNLSFPEIMEKEASADDFTKEVGNQLDVKMKSKYRVDTGRYDFEKAMLQNLVAQEVGDFIEMDTR